MVANFGDYLVLQNLPMRQDVEKPMDIHNDNIIKKNKVEIPK